MAPCGAGEIVGAVRAAVYLAHQIFVGQEKRPKVHRVGLLNHRHQQRARTVLLFDIDREAEAHVLVVAHARRALVVDGLDEGRVH